MTASEYAKQTGWRSLKECADWLGYDRSSLSRMWRDYPKKARAIITGAWVEKGKVS